MKKLGTPAPRSFQKPACSQGHDPSKMRREQEGWVCLDCLDDWFAQLDPQSKGGVELPSGVVDTRKKFSVVMPNRRVRRRYR